MLKIYGMARSRAFRTLWMAKELGLEYENIALNPMSGTETRTPEFLAINPNGHVPAIDDDGFVLWESMAINLYLAKKHARGSLYPIRFEDEAKTWLNKIRFRSGMPAITESGAALKDRYRNERRIEMLFEEQRYHDARRWMIAPTTLGRKVTFINVSGKFKPGKELAGKYHHDKEIYDYTYTPVEDRAHEDRQWIDKMYYRPITRDEINKNEKLIQNPGYD